MRRTERLFSLILAIAVLTAFSSSAAMAEGLEEKVREFKLDNGMKFLVVERHEAPVAFGAIVFDVGSANEWPNVTGISHLLEHMMFKGTKMTGTKDYEAEIPYLAKTDSLGEMTIELRKEIGEWRFEILENFARDVVSGFSEEEAEMIGTDKAKENHAFVDAVRGMESLPDSILSKKYLLKDEGVDYLEKFLEYKTAWAKVLDLIAEQREKFIVNNELWELYQNNGARFLNAGTSNDFTVYFAYLPANRMELWMVLESDRMDSPIFREFWVERDVVMEERRLGENDPDEILDESFYAAAFKACPYKWPVVGWMSDLRTIDREEVEEYHRVHYAPNNATAVVVGDVSVDKVRKMAEKYFGPIPAQDPAPAVETREPEQQGEKRIVIEHSANPKLMIGYHKPSYPDPEGLAFDMMMSVLGDGRTSRMYKTIYEEKELTAEPPRVYTGPSERYDNLMVISAEPRHPHTLEEVEAAVYEELEKLKEEPVSDRELQRIRNQIDAQMVRQLGSNLGIAFQVLMGEIYFGDYTEMFKMTEKLKRVTPEEIQDAAKKYITEKNRIVGYRVQVEEEKADDEALSDEELMKKYQGAIMRFVQSLPPAEQAEIMQKFQSMRSQQEMMEYGKELFDRAKAAGFIKEDE